MKVEGAPHRVKPDIGRTVYPTVILRLHEVSSQTSFHSILDIPIAISLPPECQQFPFPGHLDMIPNAPSEGLEIDEENQTYETVFKRVTAKFVENFNQREFQDDVRKYTSSDFYAFFNTPSGETLQFNSSEWITFLENMIAVMNREDFAAEVVDMNVSMDRARRKATVSVVDGLRERVGGR